MKENRTRVQLDISNESLKNLDKLCKKTSAISRSSVIRKSLGLYQRMLELIDEGANLYIEKNGEKIQILFTDLK